MSMTIPARINSAQMAELARKPQNLLVGNFHQLAPNRVKVNRVWIVRHANVRKDWMVLAQNADEAKRQVLNDEPRLSYDRLTAEEANR